MVLAGRIYSGGLRIRLVEFGGRAIVLEDRMDDSSMHSTELKLIYPRRGPIRVLRTVFLFSWAIVLFYVFSVTFGIYTIVLQDPTRLSDPHVWLRALLPYANFLELPSWVYVAFVILLTIVFVGGFWALLDTQREGHASILRDVAVAFQGVETGVVARRPPSAPGPQAPAPTEKDLRVERMRQIHTWIARDAQLRAMLEQEYQPSLARVQDNPGPANIAANLGALRERIDYDMNKLSRDIARSSFILGILTGWIPAIIGIALTIWAAFPH
jgi:hypothetical protein